MMAHQNNMDFNRLNITNLAPKQYSPNMGKKIAPVVPPKPKKALGTSSDGLNFRNGSPTPVPAPEGPTNSYSDPDYDKGDGSEGAEKRGAAALPYKTVLQPSTDGYSVGNGKPRPFVPTESGAKFQPSTNGHFPYQPPSNGQAGEPPKYSAENGSRFRNPAGGETGGNYPAGAQQAQPQQPPPPPPNYPNDPNYSNSANYSNPSNYSNSSNYSNASNYSNMANYSDSSNYSNSSNYSDFSNYDHYRPPGSLTSYGAYTPPLPEDELPPPPPPEPSSYSPSTNHNFPPPPPDEFPPPPSPVSSSYSELRRAANAQNYATYGPVSSQSSTYESIYEPIHPRPPSQISNRSLYSTGSSLYAPYGSNKGKAQGAVPQTRTGTGESGPVKEDEVDVLTNLLVRSMENSGDPDFFGICSKCGEKVTGEGTGCTAMEHVFHITCFTCFICQTPLQGKPFYAMDGKPYCEEDYLNTLEKCSVCTQPILDRILRATGKPYHPRCFTCVVCGKSLDGIPFTVDATNQIHCIEDFHKKFAPRCCVCKQPIMPQPGLQETVRVVALDKSFHVNCYKCEDCGLVLSSEAEGRGCYPLDDHILCKSCNAKRVQLLTSRMATEL